MRLLFVSEYPSHADYLLSRHVPLQTVEGGFKLLREPGFDTPLYEALEAPL
jgi:hypothetical protein